MSPASPYATTTVEDPDLRSATVRPVLYDLYRCPLLTVAILQSNMSNIRPGSSSPRQCALGPIYKHPIKNQPSLTKRSSQELTTTRETICILRSRKPPQRPRLDAVNIENSAVSCLESSVSLDLRYPRQTTHAYVNVPSPPFDEFQHSKVLNMSSPTQSSPPSIEFPSRFR
jgi:hypothetical protein